MFCFELPYHFIVVVIDLLTLLGGQRGHTGFRQRVQFRVKGSNATDSPLGGVAIAHAKLILMEQIILTVTGMTCGGCENAVKRALSRLDGINTVTASHADNRVVVDYDSAKVNRAAMSDAIHKAGYQVQPG
jgi:copper chaperone